MRTCKRQSSEGVRAERNPYPQLARGGGDRRWESAFQLERHDPSTAVRGRVPEMRESDIHHSRGKTLVPLGPILALLTVLSSSSPAGIFSQSTPQSHNSDQPSHLDGFSPLWTTVRNCPARRGRNRGESMPPTL